MNQTLNIIRNLDRNQFDVSLITLFPEESKNSMIDQYLEVCKKHICTKLKKFESIFVGRRMVTEILEKWKPDIVQGVGMPPYRMTLGYHKGRHLVTLRNYMYEDYPSHYNKIVGPVLAYLDMKLIRNLYKRGEVFITCSESLSKMYKEKENIELPFIRNGVDVEKFQKRNLKNRFLIRKNLNLPNDKIIYVYSGGLIERKNHREAINAFINMTNYDKALLLILGDGELRLELEREFEKYKNVLFMGKVSNITEYLHASDIYLSTSKSEGLPNGVLEAMACGIPVLLSNIPQHMEIYNIEKNIGYIYTLGNEIELKEKMDQMMTENTDSMGETSYHCVLNNFTSAVMSKCYQDLYFDMLRS